MPKLTQASPAPYVINPTKLCGEDDEAAGGTTGRGKRDAMGTGDLREPSDTRIWWEDGVCNIEDHHMCFGLGGYFMSAVLAVASYSKVGFSLYFAVCAWRVRVQGGSKFHL